MQLSLNEVKAERLLVIRQAFKYHKATKEMIVSACSRHLNIKQVNSRVQIPLVTHPLTSFTCASYKINPQMKASSNLGALPCLNIAELTNVKEANKKIHGGPSENFPFKQQLMINLRIVEAHVLMNASKTGISENLCPYTDSRFFFFYLILSWLMVKKMNNCDLEGLGIWQTKSDPRAFHTETVTLVQHSYSNLKKIRF